MDTPFTVMRDKIKTLLQASTSLGYGSLISRIEDTEDGLLVYTDNMDTESDKRHFEIVITEVPGW